MRVTDDRVMYEDGEIQRRGSRTLAWRWWGEPGGIPILRLQGTPGSRLARHPNPAIQRDLGVRYLMADRPGYGGATRLPGRGVADFAAHPAGPLDHPQLGPGAAVGPTGGGPPSLAVEANRPRPTAA